MCKRIDVDAMSKMGQKRAFCFDFQEEKAMLDMEVCCYFEQMCCCEFIFFDGSGKFISECTHVWFFVSCSVVNL